jgi:hypothetical protein
MADLASTEFAQALAVIESLGSAYDSARDGLEKGRIEEAIRRAVYEIPSDQLASFMLYAGERVRQGGSTVADAHNTLTRLEAELERRRSGQK